MKHRTFIAAVVIMMISIGLMAQSYQTLWKQVQEAQRKDLPQTAISCIQKIEEKAAKEKAYGQLMKSTLLHARLQAEVAPDSLAPAVKRLEEQEERTKDVALKAVYDAVLSVIYKENHEFSDDWEAKSNDYAKKAMAHPEALAAVKTDGYEPFVIKGEDSEYYGHDLLSVVGAELNAWSQLRDYYEKVGNRQAACMAALKVADDIQELDALIARYGDLPEACELAIARYSLMKSGKFTAAEKASWLQESLRRWGTWKRANNLRNSWAALTQPRFLTEVPQRVMEPHKVQMVKLKDLCHLQQMTMRVFKTNLTGETELDPENEKDFKEIKGGLKEIEAQKQIRQFKHHEDYEEFDDSLQLPELAPGVYMLEFSSLPQTKVSRMLYFVSGVRMMIQSEPDNKIRYVVVDATTGQPISKASVKSSYSYGWNTSDKMEQLTCDKAGEVVLQTEKNNVPREVFAYTETDRFCPRHNAYGRYSYYDRTYHDEHTNLFTDRSIYRPGQTVMVTAVLWKEQSVLEQVAIADRTITIELYDANYKQVAEKQVTTDRFGKCSTQFTLPTGSLNGRFTIRTKNGSTSIRVEEYKRPSFQVEFADYQQSYQKGDTVRAQGKALTYAGVPVQGAKVKYVVRRKVAFWWMSYSRYWQQGFWGTGSDSSVMKEGETTTADDGTFQVLMPMVLPDEDAYPMFYRFEVEADVTDMAGETHSGTMSLPLGTQSTALTCDIPQQVRKDQLPQVTFNRCNAAGKAIEGQVNYRLDGGKWQKCAANAAMAILPNSLKSGEHRLEAVCEQDTVNTTFVVFSLTDKKPAFQTSDWFYVSHKQFPNDGSPVTVQVGSSDPDLHIVYGIFSGNQLIERGAVDKDAALLNRQFVYKEAYGNGLLLTFAWVKNGKCYRHQATISRPMPDKQLKMSWETFRDLLVPGQQEQWTMKVQYPDGKPADASLMAVLYDKSLDAITSHGWSFSPVSYLSQPSARWQWGEWGSLRGTGSQGYKTLNVPLLKYSRFDKSVYPYYQGFGVRIRGSHPMLMSKTGAVPMRAVAAKQNMVKMDAADGMAVEDHVVAGLHLENAEVVSAEPSAEQVQLRENLNETAFCYPQLQTDEEGRVVIKFTLPESLTTWRFMGVTNTPDMYYGYMEDEVVAKKDVMIQPNMPRFIRMGDEAQLSARIMNTSEKTISGTAKMQLIDPETQQVVDEQKASFTMEAGKTASVQWPLSVGRSSCLLICKVSAVGEGFSDGEQHYLPVLPDREYVTKTVPYTQHETGVKTIDLTKLFPAGTTQQKLTVEYTNNPVWLMVQSLPIVGQPSEHSAIDQAASYYSNLLAKTLLAQSPQVKTVFEQWKREQGSETSLMSNLQKDQELKDLVLNETPWVGDADRETEQKQRLADFFDENGINNRLNSAVEKLKKLQNADGSFSWYPGMQGSTYITVAVEEMLVRLNLLAGKQTDTKQMQDKAFAYIGKEMVKLVAEMKKEQKKGRKPSFPSFTALRWLYLCAIDGRPLEPSVKSANNYLIALLKKDIKNQTMYEKALTAVVLAKDGAAKKAAEYVKSLKEYTVYTEEMGRYYDAPRATYSWYDYKIPTEVAAIEAIQMVTPADTKTVDEMRRWLLQEKRTQAWDTPINSINAIWAFMNGKEKSLVTAQPQTTLAVDGQPLALPKATAGVGYVKTAIQQPKGHTFTATKTSEGTSWGTVYAQFFQQTADIAASQSDISVKRELMGTGNYKVGDKVKVRITIETKRDLDFVQVVDRRAACMEPVRQLSGYQQGAYVSPKDAATHYSYDQLSKGKHVIITEYYIDRVGRYETGTCTVGCAYAPAFRATAPSQTLLVKE